SRKAVCTCGTTAAGYLWLCGRDRRATACVAALSQEMLDDGKEFCCLYTDLSNRTSNDIYMSIGFKPVCDVDDYFFE
ncbi:MAG: hypothetical protein VB860_04865, partial [Dehalococcoidia bacterium]